jgi:hypothetical protein
MFLILGRKDLFSFHSKKNTIFLSCDELGDVVIVVSVYDFVNEKLIDGLFGSCLSCFPRYLMRAMFDGERCVTCIGVL